ncbi:MAG TPA: S1/P1 nuclease, partial [Tepidisphaeraceae bacterium]
KQIAEILKAHPHYEKLLLENRPTEVSAEEWAFLKAATWPDMVRPARQGDKYKPPTITRYHKGSWHYSDIPYVLGEFKRPATSEPAENAITALHANLKILSDKQAKPEDRAVALAWVEHIIGDIHQPLHAVSLYSEKFPKGDQGGNAEVVRAGGEVKRLHGFWDDALGTLDDYPSIDARADTVSKLPDADAKKKIKADTTPESWLKESHDLAVAQVYEQGKLQFGISQDWEAKKITPDQVPALPDRYINNAKELAKQQVLLASLRLAEQIKEALKE